MPVFNYKAENKKGRTKSGQIVAVSEGDALRKLSKKMMKVKKIKDVSDSLIVKINNKLTPIKNKDLVIFSRQFAVMISAHVTVTEALYIIIEQTENPHFKSVIANVAYDVDGGDLLSDALKQNSGIFSDFYCNLIKAGETSGKLDEILVYLADEMEKDFDMLNKFKGAMIYPAFILVGLLAVGIVFIFFVLPELTTMLQETNSVLPLPTRIVIAITEFGQNYYLLIIIAFIISAFLFRMFLKTKFGKRRFDYFVVNIPSIGKLFRLVYLVRFCRSLSTLLKGGVSMNKSLTIVEDILGSTVYKDIIRETVDNVSEGGSIITALDNSKYVPKMIPEMMAVGEKTGRLDDILEEVAKFYDKDVRGKLDNISAIIEPAIMVIMGLGVGIMVAAIILPMYNMASQF